MKLTPKRVDLNDSSKEKIQNNNSDNKISNSRKFITSDLNLEKNLEKQSLGSNQNFSNDETIVKENPTAYSTEELQKLLKKNKQKNHLATKSTKENDSKPWEVDRKNGAKVYELIGYTTAGKINQKSDRENRQYFIKRILILVLLISILILTLIIINPFKENSEWKRILGIDSYLKNSEQEEIEINIIDTDEDNLETSLEDENN
ncbi:MAG: hypothetical protein GX326_00945 [Clostridiaceae bacterium]|nr:hypothetical protein [Clostridiaceae bacterium]